jgi:hypothetical protein
LSDAKAWRCTAHREGHEDDLEPWRPRLAYGPGGAIIDLDEQEAEAERGRIEEESRAAKRKVREAELAAEGEEREAARRAYRARVEKETPPGIAIA